MEKLVSRYFNLIELFNYYEIKRWIYRAILKYIQWILYTKIR